MDFFKEVESIERELINIRRMLHKTPELSNQEFKTTAFIKKFLVDRGIEIEECGLKTGISAIIRGAKKGLTYGIRADIDALPIKEMTGLEFSSQIEGVSHSCGHDIHTSILLGCADIMNRYKEHMSGNIRLLFQAAEETAEGALEMIKLGCVENEPKMDIVLGLHVHPFTKSGKICIKEGPFEAASDVFKITVVGQGGHGAYPHKCADPITAGAYLITQLQTIISRENMAVKPAVFSIGRIHAGEAANVIPSQLEMNGTLRTFYSDSRERIIDAMKRICVSCCESLNTKGILEFKENNFPPLVNDSQITKDIETAAIKSIGEENISYLEFPISGSDDFSFYLNYCKGAHFFIGTANNDSNSSLGNHLPNNIYDEKSIITGTKVLTQYLFDKLVII